MKENNNKNPYKNETKSEFAKRIKNEGVKIIKKMFKFIIKGFSKMSKINNIEVIKAKIVFYWKLIRLQIYIDRGFIYFIITLIISILSLFISILLNINDIEIKFLIFNYQFYNVIVTAHAFIMVFYLIMPTLIGFFKLPLISIKLISYFKFSIANTLSFWLLTSAFILLFIFIKGNLIIYLVLLMPIIIIISLIYNLNLLYFKFYWRIFSHNFIFKIWVLILGITPFILYLIFINIYCIFFSNQIILLVQLSYFFYIIFLIKYHNNKKLLYIFFLITYFLYFSLIIFILYHNIINYNNETTILFEKNNYCSISRNWKYNELFAILIELKEKFDIILEKSEFDTIIKIYNTPELMHEYFENLKKIQDSDKYKNTENDSIFNSIYSYCKEGVENILNAPMEYKVFGGILILVTFYFGIQYYSNYNTFVSSPIIIDNIIPDNTIVEPNPIVEEVISELNQNIIEDITKTKEELQIENLRKVIDENRAKVERDYKLGASLNALQDLHRAGKVKPESIPSLTTIKVPIMNVMSPSARLEPIRIIEINEAISNSLNPPLNKPNSNLFLSLEYLYYNFFDRTRNWTASWEWKMKPFKKD